MAAKLRQQGVTAKLAGLTGLIQRFTILFFVIAAFALMMLGKADAVLVERTRTAIADFAAPILDALSRPAATLDEMVAQVRELGRLRDENARLREEVARLRSWHSVATNLAAENQALREMLNFVPPPRASFVSARVIADGGGPFARSVLVNVGSRDGIGKGQAVVNDAGLIGRVIAVGHRSARVLLLTDFNSRIPVILESTRDRAIVAGDNSPQMQLAFLPLTAGPKIGDRIVTSGHGGHLPAGLPVGVIASTKDGAIRVQPFADWARLEYVRVVDFPPPGPPEAEAVEEQPAEQGASNKSSAAETLPSSPPARERAR